jgi:hypothetical protein
LYRAFGNSSTVPGLPGLQVRQRNPPNFALNFHFCHAAFFGGNQLDDPAKLFELALTGCGTFCVETGG